MSAGRYRRCDGAHLSEHDLAECVPIHPSELEELAWPIDLVEDWLLHTSHATLDDLARFINDDRGPSPADVTDHLGRASLMLHRLIRATRSRG